jgi:hypothetical protein
MSAQPDEQMCCPSLSPLNVAAQLRMQSMKQLTTSSPDA